MACHAHTYKILGRRHKNLTVCPMKDFRLHMSARATDGTYLKKLSPVRPKTALEIRKRKKRTSIAKCFALYANTIMLHFSTSRIKTFHLTILLFEKPNLKHPQQLLVSVLKIKQAMHFLGEFFWFGNLSTIIHCQEIIGIL